MNKLARFGAGTAIVTRQGQRITYARLDQLVRERVGRLRSASGLVLIEMANAVDPLVTYLAALRAQRPALLVARDASNVGDIIRRFRPASRYAFEGDGWRLVDLDHHADSTPPCHPELALLLPTSGSTGASKLVRLSASSLQANADSIAEYLRLTPDDRAVTTLPSHYSYGLSVIHSHLSVGATLLLTDESVTDGSFWDFCREQQATSFAGVPHTFELLDRVGFADMDLSSLRYITQAGGKLEPAAVARYAELARQKGFDFYVMYGQTEATARIAYVPPEQILENPAAVGGAVPGGRLRLVDEDGRDITLPDVTGELVYTGPNVMMGYAESPDDLARGRETSELRTGDLAQRQPNGLFRVVGRRSRFLKIYGLRIGLDEVERYLAQQNVHAACTGNDQTLVIATAETPPPIDVQSTVSRWTKLPPDAIRTRHYDRLPRLASGKTDYRSIIRELLPEPDTDTPATPANPVAQTFAHYLGVDDIRPEDTFTDLGGDSLTYVQVSVALEERLGQAPPGWQDIPVGQLEARQPRLTLLKHTEMSVCLRALAILGVVGVHIGYHTIHGGAYLLMALAGMSFARFQAAAAYHHDSVLPIVQSALRIALPTMTFVLAMQVWWGEYHLSLTLMYSNLVSPNIYTHLAPWFIQILLQVFAVMMVLFAFKPVRRIANQRPYRFGLSLLIIALAARVTVPWFWESDDLLYRTPHMLTWLFVLGFCLNAARDNRQRLVNTALLLGAALPMAPNDDGMQVFILAALALIWGRYLPTLWPLNHLVGVVGAASLYIYLTHLHFHGLVLEHAPNPTPTLSLIAAVVGGIAVWYVVEKSMTLAARWVRRMRR
ncbi:MAG: AMP-binding protein [Planctomycetota bacterium]